MPPPCNKCKQGGAQEGDSWCLGCSSLELSQGLLKQPWRQVGLRAVAEECLLSSARVVRALANLDQSLVVGGAGSSDRAPATAAKSKASRAAPSRSPRRDERPPLPRSPGRVAKTEPRSDRESDDSEFFDEEEEEEDKPITEVPRERRSSDRAPEPEGPPRGRAPAARPPPRPEREHHREGEGRSSKRKAREGSGKRKRRGGTKHQRRYKDLENPFRRSHRKIRGDLLELSTNLEDGLARRY